MVENQLEFFLEGMRGKNIFLNISNMYWEWYITWSVFWLRVYYFELFSVLSILVQNRRRRHHPFQFFAEESK